MRIIKGKYPNGDLLYTAIPTTTKDIEKIWSVYGIHAMLVKYGQRYDICYPSPREQGGPIFIANVARTVQDMTAKRWLELADQNCPDRNRKGKDILWTEMKKYVEKETLS